MGLLEHILSYLLRPSDLSGVGQVCTEWYLASRMQTLWELQLRRWTSHRPRRQGRCRRGG